MQSYESSTSLQKRRKQILVKKDIFEVCRRKKIRDEEFIKFLIKHGKKKKHWILGVESGNIYQEENEFWLFLGIVANSLLRDIEVDKEDNTNKEESLLELIRSTGEFFKEIVFDRSKRLIERESALDVLQLMNHPERYDIAFKLLEKIDTDKKFEYYEILNFDDDHKTFATELDAFRRTIESLIFSYGNENHIDCRKRLYAILDNNLGSIKEKTITFTNRERKLKKEVLYLLDMTRENPYTYPIPMLNNIGHD